MQAAPDYIFHVLDNIGDLPNAIVTAAYQFAGPIAFEQFLQDTVAEWEKLHNKHIRIALVTGKNTVDAILADPVRSKQIAVVDMRYWEYQPDGTLFAPDAGQNIAFRELISTHFKGYTDTPPPTTPEMVYRQVREYRDRYPNIALLPMEEGAGPLPILMGEERRSRRCAGASPCPRLAPMLRVFQVRRQETEPPPLPLAMTEADLRRMPSSTDLSASILRPT